MQFRPCLPLLLVAAVPLLAQKPIINAVVNAASFANPATPEGAIAAGSIATVFGQNLAPGTQQVSGPPLPFELSGVRVTFACVAPASWCPPNGAPAAIFYISPTQINVQVPSSLMPFGGQFVEKGSIIVSTPSGSSDPLAVNIAASNPGIFTLNSAGCGQGAVLNALSDGNVRIHGPDASVQPGDWVSIYLTGLGLVGNQSPDGQPSLYTPRSAAPFGVGGYTLGRISYVLGLNPPSYLGRAPGAAGLDQVNIQIPEGAPEGCQVPFRLWSPFAFSQPVPLSIHTGRGTCFPQPVSLAFFEWSKTYFNNALPTEQIRAILSRGETNDFPHQPRIGEGSSSSQIPAPGPDCPGLLPDALDAGTITIQTLGGQIDVRTPSSLGAGGEASLPLPTGTVGSGAHNVTIAGGKEVGPFSSTVGMPLPVQVTSQFPPGATIACNQPLTVNWTGADDYSVVEVRVKTFNSGYETDMYADLPGSAGTFTFSPVTTTSHGVPVVFNFAVFCNAPAEIDITQTANPAALTNFSATGLSLGGRNTWKYQFRFQGLKTVGPPL